MRTGGERFSHYQVTSGEVKERVEDTEYVGEEERIGFG